MTDTAPLVDLMAGHKTQIDVLDHGFVRLVDAMPRLVPQGQTAESAIVQMARTSYGEGTKQVSEDRGLVRYLMRHRHTSPIEGVEFKFHIKLPLYVMRQLIRHRMASVNEYSARYSVLRDEFHLLAPEEVRGQSQSNRQGSEGLVDALDAAWFANVLEDLSREAYATYEQAIERGVTRELARALLPVNVYTECYWKIDLHNLLHCLALRCDNHAQAEIRVFADAMLNLIRPLAPMAIEAWEDYHPLRGGLLMSRLEVDVLRKIIAQQGRTTFSADELQLDSDNKRENKEWIDKLTSRFGITTGTP